MSTFINFANNSKKNNKIILKCTYKTRLKYDLTLLIALLNEGVYELLIGKSKEDSSHTIIATGVNLNHQFSSNQNSIKTHQNMYLSEAYLPS